MRTSIHLSWSSFMMSLSTMCGMWPGTFRAVYPNALLYSRLTWRKESPNVSRSWRPLNSDTVYSSLVCWFSFSLKVHINVPVHQWHSQYLKMHDWLVLEFFLTIKRFEAMNTYKLYMLDNLKLNFMDLLVPLLISWIRQVVPREDYSLAHSLPWWHCQGQRLPDWECSPFWLADSASWWQTAGSAPGTPPDDFLGGIFGTCPTRKLV